MSKRNNKRQKTVAEDLKDDIHENEHNISNNLYNMIKNRSTIHRQQAIELLNSKQTNEEKLAAKNKAIDLLYAVERGMTIIKNESVSLDDYENLINLCIEITPESASFMKLLLVLINDKRNNESKDNNDLEEDRKSVV